jgi:putative ABC transport system permease protein
MPILRGRSFAITDRKDSPRVAVVNNAFAEKYLGADPIGKRVRLENENGPLVEIVGVTATAKYLSIAEPPTGFLYLPLAQNQESRMTLLVQSNGDPASLAGPVREIARSIDSNVPVLGIRTMDDLFQRSTVQAMNMVVTLLGSVSLMGFVLALAGLYAVVAYQVARKTREIGIRIALGAERPQVMRMILKQAASMGVTGVLAGLALSFALQGR